MTLKLLWKEIRENLWKFSLLCLAYGLLVLLLRNSDLSHRADIFLPCLIFGSWISPIWVASSTFVSERRMGSLDVLLAMPAHPLRIFTIKAVVGLATILLPIALTLLFCSRPEDFGDGVYSRREWPWVYAALIIPVAIYFAALTFTTRTRTESRAAMIGVLALLASLGWGVTAVALSESSPWPWLLFNPTAMMFVSNRVPEYSITTSLTVQGISVLFWVWIAGWRFYRTTSRVGTGDETREEPYTKTLLLPTGHSPLFWKEIREQGSVIIAAFWGGVLMAFLAGAIELVTDARHQGTPPSLYNAFEVVIKALLIAAAVVPVFIAIVLGVGSISGDLEERLFNFWRGQPIPAGRWFWTKYLVSVAGILALFLVPLSLSLGSLIFFSDNQPANPAYYLPQNAGFAIAFAIVAIPVAHATAIFFASLLRHAMYATIVTVLALLCVGFIPFIPNLGSLGDMFYLEHGNPPVLLTFIVVSVAVTASLLLLSRLVLARNWRTG